VNQPVIPLAKPSLDEREAEAAQRAIRSGWVTQGPEVEAFEREFAAAVGAAHACAVSSCTAGLHLAGDEVLVPSHSFIATANSIRYGGARPVFVEIEAATYNLDPAQLEALWTPKTRAVLCVHQMGLPCDLASILAWAEGRGLPVIEDAACAIGSRIRWRGNWERIGRPHGAAACFSFHPRKVLTTGDGGMITTNDAAWDQQFRRWRQHGMNVSDRTRHQSNEVIFEAYEDVGFNYRMTDIQAAIGREQLKKLDGLIATRRRLADRYRRLLAPLPGLVAPADLSWTESNWQTFCVRLPDRCDQKQVMQLMMNQGVSTRRGIMCSHREPAYAETHRQVRLPVSEAAQDHSICLPLYAQMTDADQDRVGDALALALAETSR
jgi:perosamine synthetase